MSACLRDCVFFMKNPIVLLFLFMCGFIQIVIFLANFYESGSPNGNGGSNLPSSSSSSSVSETKHKENTAPSGVNVYTRGSSHTLRLDWQFNTVFKVIPLKTNLTSSATDRRSDAPVSPPPPVLPVNDYIHYGSEDFQYPLLVDMLDVVRRVHSGQRISVAPVNQANFTYKVPNPNKCVPHSQPLHLLILVKSAPANALAREVIRSTWGKQRCWGGYQVRLVFLFGRARAGEEHDLLEKGIQEEARVYGDVVQQEFVDHYFNNTYKMMMGFQWALEFCPNVRDLLFVDDDYFVHPRAVVSYLASLSEAMQERLVAGYVYRMAYPVRSKRGATKKWFVEYHEYPWHTYPPYCAAGAFFVSMRVARDVAVAMRYTRYLRFDDVFLGIILHKLSMNPMHLAQVHSFVRVDPKSRNFASMLASHGYKEPHDIFHTWQQLHCDSFCVST